MYLTLYKIYFPLSPSPNPQTPHQSPLQLRTNSHPVVIGHEVPLTKNACPSYRLTHPQYNTINHEREFRKQGKTTAGSGLVAGVPVCTYLNRQKRRIEGVHAWKRVREKRLGNSQSVLGCLRIRIFHNQTHSTCYHRCLVPTSYMSHLKDRETPT
jgi:hypothetical protein